MLGFRVWKRYFIGLSVGLLLLPAGLVGALAAPEKTEFLPIAPLMITAFGTSSGYTDLDFIEIYNSGKGLVDLADWKIVDTANDRQLVVSTDAHGWIEPGRHVIVARDGVFDGPTTYRLEGWNGGMETTKPIDNLDLISSGYRSQSAKILAKTTELDDRVMIRTYNTASYSTAASPFESPYRSLFDDGLYQPSSGVTLEIVEIYPYASACEPGDDSVLCGDYVKLQNTGSADMELDGLVLRSSSNSASPTSTNTFMLSGTLAPGGYYSVNHTDSGGQMTLVNSGGYVWIEDIWHMVRYDGTMTSYPPAGDSLQGYSYALDANGSWVWTSTPNPVGDNILTPQRVELTPCAVGQERNAETNRCRAITTSSSILTPCKVGQERNPETNRCRAIIGIGTELTPCAAGQERNLETNRCRKIAGEVLGAEYPVEPTSQKSSNFLGLWTLLIVVGLALVYAVWEWRSEIMRLGRWLVLRMHARPR